MSDDGLLLLPYRDPVTDEVYIADQHGRRVDGVRQIEVNSDTRGNQTLVLSLNIPTGIRTTPIPTRANVKLPPIPPQRFVKTEHGDAVQIDDKSLVVLRVPLGTSKESMEEMAAAAAKVAEDFDGKAVFIVVTSDVEVEVFGLKPEIFSDKRRKTGYWDF